VFQVEVGSNPPQEVAGLLMYIKLGAPIDIFVIIPVAILGVVSLIVLISSILSRVCQYVKAKKRHSLETTMVEM